MPNRPGNRASLIALVAREGLKSFRKNGDFDEAASLAYYGFFAFIPIFFIVTAFLSTYMYKSEVVMVAIERVVSRIFPYAPGVITKEVAFLSEHKGAVGIVGFIALFWSITPLTNAVRAAFARSFNVARETPFLKGAVFDILAVSMIIVLFASLLLSEVFFFALEETFSETHPLFLTLVDYIGPVIGVFLVVFFFLVMFAPVRPRVLHLAVASGIISVLWTVIKEIFSRFLLYNPHYGFAFGSLKATFIIVLWSYLSFCVLLLGVEIMAVWREQEAIILRDLFMKTKRRRQRPGRAVDTYARTYDKGAELFHEGEEGDYMYYILSGSVDILARGRVIASLGEGRYFGEYSMLLGEPRVTTAIVAEPETRLALISRDTFQTILRENPAVAVSVLKEMAGRLKVIARATLEA